MGSEVGAVIEGAMSCRCRLYRFVEIRVCEKIRSDCEQLIPKYGKTSIYMHIDRT